MLPPAALIARSVTVATAMPTRLANADRVAPPRTPLPTRNAHAHARKTTHTGKGRIVAVSQVEIAPPHTPTDTVSAVFSPMSGPLDGVRPEESNFGRNFVFRSFRAAMSC